MHNVGMKKYYGHITGTGSALPATCLTNEQLIALHGLDSSDEWIVSRSGITQRYFCGEGESTSTLAAKAAEKALENAELVATDIDTIIVATCTPDQTFPSVAMQVQRLIGSGAGAAFDVNAVCGGFVYALGVVDGLMQTGQTRKALVIGAERFSNLLNWEDRGTCVLFGDGAGAVVVEAKEEKGGLLSSRISGDGCGEPYLYSSGGVGTTGEAGYVVMQGREVFKQAVKTMGTLDDAWLAEYSLTKSDIDWVVPHQANIRILKAAAESAGIPFEKVVVTVDKHANTSAATIPLALDDYARKGRFHKENVLYLQAFGAGFTWGEVLIKWTKTS